MLKKPKRYKNIEEFDTAQLALADDMKDLEQKLRDKNVRMIKLEEQIQTIAEERNMGLHQIENMEQEIRVLKNWIVELVQRTGAKNWCKELTK